MAEHRHYSILYVEDDPDDVLLMKEAFDKWPEYEILTANDGFKALQLLCSWLDILQPMPVLIVMDINLPLMDGRTTLTRIRSIEQLQEIPIVLFSTSLSPADKAHAMKHRAIPIPKPRSYMDVEHLASQLTQYCRF